MKQLSLQSFKSVIICYIFIAYSINLLHGQSYVWAKGLGGGNSDYGHSIAVDASGNVYTIGYFVSSIDIDPGPAFNFLTSAGNSDIFISKLDQNGAFVWGKRIGGTGFEYGNALTLDPSGNIYIAGAFNTTVDFDPGPGSFSITSSGNSDAFVTKLDGNGNFIWAKKLGGPNFEVIRSVAVDGAGNVITTGTFDGLSDFDPGTNTYTLNPVGTDVFISKLDLNGNFIWAQQIGGKSNDYSNALYLDSTGDIYVTGTFLDTTDFDPGISTYTLASSPALCDVFITKMGGSGNFVWAKGISGPADEYGNSIAVDAAGSVYITGQYSLTADFDPGVGTYTLTSLGNKEIFISKLDPNGDFVWAKSIGGANADFAYSLTLDNNANIYVTGAFTGVVDFDPGPGIYNISSWGNTTDIFILKLDSSSNLLWARNIGGPGIDVGSFITNNNVGNIYITGWFDQPCDFNPPNLAWINPYSITDAFAAKYSSFTTDISENSNKLFNVCPNPNNGEFNINFISESEEYKIAIYNNLGMKVHQQMITKGMNQIDTKLSSGLYTLIIQDLKTISNYKLIIE